MVPEQRQPQIEIFLPEVKKTSEDANPKALKPVGKEGQASQQHVKVKKANPKALKPIG
jgi:hypothetical protein